MTSIGVPCAAKDLTMFSVYLQSHVRYVRGARPGHGRVDLRVQPRERRWPAGRDALVAGIRPCA
jgi:hypothetical protein